MTELQYPSGRLAVLQHRGKLIVYDDAPGNIVLTTWDRQGVGTAMYRNGRPRLSVTSKGGMLLRPDMIEEYSWDWEPSRVNRRERGYNRVIKLQLNSFVLLTVTSRSEITVELPVQQRTFQVGRAKRHAPSLDTSSSPTLRDRQNELSLKMRAKAQLNRPRSDRMANDQLRRLMQGLEDHFDPLPSSQGVLTFIDGEWRKNAFNMTAGEIPRIRCAGTESGAEPRLYALGCTAPLPGSSGYEKRETERRPEVKRWPSLIEVKRAARARNPSLPRNADLRRASGRYMYEPKL